MLTVWFNIGEDDEIEISREDVSNNTNTTELLEWHEALTQSIIDMVYTGKAMKECGVPDGRDLAYKLGRQRMAQDWIGRRLEYLDCPIPRDLSRIEKLESERDILKNRLAHLVQMVESANGSLRNIINQF